MELVFFDMDFTFKGVQFHLISADPTHDLRETGVACEKQEQERKSFHIVILPALFHLFVYRTLNHVVFVNYSL